MIKRGCIVAKIKPGAEEEVAKLFRESDESELPRLAGVRHRSLFVLDDVYIHYVETDDDFAEAVDAALAEGRPGARVLQLGPAGVAAGELLQLGGRVG